MTGLRHVRARSVSGNNNSQRTTSSSTNSTNLLSQKSNVKSSHPSSEKRRGRRMRATVELRVPPRGRKVGLQPKGERIPWCKEVAWPGLCCYWTSKGYKTNRGRGREARLKSEDIAQNRGGSRPFAEAQQYLEETLGPEKATTLNTYTAMKCGMKNVSSSGNNGTIISNGAIMSQKAQKRIDDYTALVKEKYPDNWEGRELDGELLYEASGGIPHGRVSIGDGVVKKEDIKSAARRRNASAPISLTLREKEQLRRANEENAELRRAKEMLQHKVDMHGQLITALFKEIGKELPAHILHILSHGAVSQPEGTNNSSQAGSQAVDGNNDVMESSEENDTTGNVGDHR